MAYCSQAQVQALLATFTIDDGSNPKSSQVTQIRDMVAAEIDGALSSQGVTVPVTAPAYFLTDITLLSALGTAAYVLLAAFPASQGINSNSQGSVFWKSYQDRLTAFRKGIGIPPTGTPGENLNSVRTFFTDLGALSANGVTDAVGDTIISEPAFSREMRF